VSILVAGHYCHDTLIGNDSIHRTLGGSAAYVSAILQALGEAHAVRAAECRQLASSLHRQAGLQRPGDV